MYTFYVLLLTPIKTSNLFYKYKRVKNINIYIYSGMEDWMTQHSCWVGSSEDDLQNARAGLEK